MNLYAFTGPLRERYFLQQKPTMMVEKFSHSLICGSLQLQLYVYLLIYADAERLISPTKSLLMLKNSPKTLMMFAIWGFEEPLRCWNFWMIRFFSSTSITIYKLWHKIHQSSYIFLCLVINIFVGLFISWKS